jgi:hypothetical protein
MKISNLKHKDLFWKRNHRRGGGGVWYGVNLKTGEIRAGRSGYRSGTINVGWCKEAASRAKKLRGIRTPAEVAAWFTGINSPGPVGILP